MNNKPDPGYQLKGDRPNLYEQYWVPALMGPCAADLVESACLVPGENVLDAACGTGVVARTAAASLSPTQVNVTGTDVNEVMLDIARRYAGLEGLDNIEWQIGDATKLPFKTSSFDVVLCQQGLQFMQDRVGALREMARVLTPEGRLLASVWKSGSPFGDALRKALDCRFGEGSSSGWGDSISLGDRIELRELAYAAGFSRCYVHYDVKMGRHHAPEEFVSGIISTTQLSDEFADLSGDEQNEVVGSVLADLSNYMDDGGLAYPAECHTLTARK